MLSGGFLVPSEHLEELDATSKRCCLPPQPLSLVNIKEVYNEESSTFPASQAEKGRLSSKAAAEAVLEPCAPCSKPGPPAGTTAVLLHPAGV